MRMTIEQNEKLFFFETMAERFQKENDLSDIIYCACKSSPQFSESFLRFVFPDENFMGDGDWNREQTSNVDNSRIDLTYTENDKDFVIENKLDDPNPHEGQYSTAYPNAQRGFIANYRIKDGPTYGIHHRIWKEFVKEAKEDKDHFGSLTEEICSYMKTICHIISLEDIKPMQFHQSDLLNLTLLPEVFKGIVFNEDVKIQYPTINWSRTKCYDRYMLCDFQAQCQGMPGFWFSLIVTVHWLTRGKERRSD